MKLFKAFLLAVAPAVFLVACGGGKIPLNPDYVVQREPKRVILRNYEGKIFEYPEPTRQPSPLSAES